MPSGGWNHQIVKKHSTLKDSYSDINDNDAVSIGTAASIGTGILYWYRGVTVLLPGGVIWKYWNCPSKFFSFGSWLVSALSIPNGEEGYNPSTDL